MPHSNDSRMDQQGNVGILRVRRFGAFALVTSAQAQAVYPLKVSANQRYLVDQNDRPFMIVGDSPQGLITDLSISDAAQYFANRASYGFNAVQIHLWVRRPSAEETTTVPTTGSLLLRRHSTFRLHERVTSTV